MLSRLAPPLIIALLGLVFFADLVLHPTATFYGDHSDLLAYYLPTKRFLVRSWQQTGEVPLWCPYCFAGMPFVGDIQTNAFYPPHLPLYLLPEQHLGPALSWLTVLHVLVAGWCMYAYARGRGLEPMAALVAALGFMFAGKWLLHLLPGGHYNVAPLAWLPLVLLWTEGAIRHASLWRAVAAAAAFALIVLGAHPQYTFYAGLLVGLASLGPALERAGYLGGGGPRSWRGLAGALGVWVALGLLIAALAGALAAVQLLPTMEASRLTTRGVGGAPPASFGVTVATLVRVVGPSLSVTGWEHQSGLGVLWLMAAALAVAWPGSERARFDAAVALLLVVFSLGGAALLDELPGFRLFRLPARMFMIASLPLSLLAAAATQRLWSMSRQPEVTRRWLRTGMAVLAVAALAVVGQVLWLRARGQAPHFGLYWAALASAVPLALWLPARWPNPAGTGWKLAWVALLLTDLWCLLGPIARVRPDAELYAPSRCVEFLAAQAPARGRVLDRDLPGSDASTPLGGALPLLEEIESVRGYNPFDIFRYKEYVQFIADKDDQVVSMGGVVNFPIRNKSLLDLLGVRYVLQPASSANDLEGSRIVATDDHPRAYCFIAGGLRDLPPYVVYENPGALPRAFVVPDAAPLPDRAEILAALKRTDFRRTVLLEDYVAGPGAPAGGSPRPAAVIDYRPNCVIVEVSDGAPGYLVLTDLWYPGWTCTIDGEPTKVYRANYVFRAVAVPQGKHTVVFRFDPASYRWGQRISLAALALVVALGAGAARFTRRPKSSR